MTFIYRIQNVYTFKITYIFIMYTLNTCFPIFIFLYIVHYIICGFFLILVLYCIPAVLFLCMSVLSCMSTKYGLIKTMIVHAVFIVSYNGLHSWNHNNLSFPWIYEMSNFFWVFVSDDFILSPLGVPPYAGFLRGFNMSSICSKCKSLSHQKV